MAYKRSRAAFEADLRAQQSPHVLYGTPLPPLDAQVRDDGSYVPIWKQDVTDERGRKRLHGAFTGGFSAGYFNTVGSKEGWTPSSFVSSKSHRQKDAASVQKPEDFMDEEDLAEAEESRNLATKDAFSGLGSTADDLLRRGTVMDIFRSTGETMGIKLLRRMGWRDGQGIGPKVRRQARLEDEDDPGGGGDQKSHLFAPENTQMISFVRKNDRKGLGFHGEARLAETHSIAGERERDLSEPDEPLFSERKANKKDNGRHGGFGVGVLNDTGSDDEDPYHMGPRISYNRVIGGDKKKRKKKPENGRAILANSDPLLRSKPIFVSKKKNALSSSASGFRKCHDGRLPLDGFLLSTKTSPPTQDRQYPPPEIPTSWKSSKTPSSSSADVPKYQSPADVAKASTHNPSTRASLLGETPLPGKSVFDYLTPSARDRIATITNNPSLPAGLAEAVPSAAAPSPEPVIPPLDSQIATAALGRGTAGFVPYTDDPAKLARYRAFLSYRANLHPEAPKAPASMRADEFVKELHEFAHAATIFKPMTGLMASRFRSSAFSGPQTSSRHDGAVPTPQPAAPKPTNPAEEAARMGMFGPLTRSSVPFYPTRLLCKRFNVPTPHHAAAAPDPSLATTVLTDAAASGLRSGGSQAPPAAEERRRPPVAELIGAEDMARLRRAGGISGDTHSGQRDPAATGGRDGGGERRQAPTVEIDPERNEALEGERPGEEIFRAIFGEDSDGEGVSE